MYLHREPVDMRKAINGLVALVEGEMALASVSKYMKKCRKPPSQSWRALLVNHADRYVGYYHSARNHLSLNKDPPTSRAIEPPDAGNIIAFPVLGGLHHRYTRIAA
jgi:hypothetical protein